MKALVQRRIDKYLSRCSENGDDFIVRVKLEIGGSFMEYKCSYCGNSLCDATDDFCYKPNFCSECGVLLDWTEENDLADDEEFSPEVKSEAKRLLKKWLSADE